MSVQLSEKENGKILEVRVSGKLSAQDYERFAPQVERLIEKHAKIRMLFDMHEFRGWEASALSEDMKFGLGHFSGVERLAMVGETKRQADMSVFCKPFTSADIRYFDRRDAAKALSWLQEGLPTANPVGEASRESFPASDAPSWTPVTGVGGPRR